MAAPISRARPTIFSSAGQVEAKSDLGRAVRQAILDFEPRILPPSLRVRALEIGNFENHNVIGVEISGQLWSQPIPIDLLVRTEIDLETGQVEVADLAPRAI